MVIEAALKALAYTGFVSRLARRLMTILRGRRIVALPAISAGDMQQGFRVCGGQSALTMSFAHIMEPVALKLK